MTARKFVLLFVPFSIQLLILATAGCRSVGAKATLTVWRNGQTQPGALSSQSTQDDSAFTHRPVELEGVINETLDLQFSLRCGPEPVAAPQLFVAPFESQSAVLQASSVRIFRMLPVRVTHWPGWHIRAILPVDRAAAPLDVLVPLSAPSGGMPRELKQGETYYFWVDLSIPKGTPPGEYASELLLRAGATIADRVPLRLTVHPFVLPDTPDVDVIAEVDDRALIAHQMRRDRRPRPFAVDGRRNVLGADESNAAVTSVMRMLRAHGLTPVLGKLMPNVRITAFDRVELDWSHYDNLAEGCLNGTTFFDGLPLQHWPLPLPSLPDPARPGEADAQEGRTDWLHSYVNSCTRHFQEKGWLERSYITLPDSAPTHSASRKQVDDLISFAHGSHPPVSVLTPGFPQDLSLYGWIGFHPDERPDSVDIWMPPGQFFDAAAMSQQRSAGRRSWISLDRPPFTGSLAIQARPVDVRVLSWQSALLNAEVLQAGCVNPWPASEDGPSPTECLQYNKATLIYPGGPFGLDEPVPSARLKYLRRSLQDAAYARMLRERGLDYVVTALRESLVAYAGTGAYRTHFLDGRPIGWPKQMEIFEIARSIMLDELARHAAKTPPDDKQAFIERTAAWRRLISETRSPQLFVDGVRVRPQSAPAATGFEIEYLLAVVNRTRAPLTGVARLTNPPEGWQASEATPVPNPVGRGQRGRIRLLANVPGLPVAADGCLDIPIEFTAERWDAKKILARVACVHVMSIDRPMRIDGDFSDWPAASTNRASNFRLISTGPLEPGQANAGRPKLQTAACFAKDRDFLYVAVEAEAAAAPDAQTSSRNQVEYEDMVPIGEELAEILIDPDNSGSRSPTDLYRIVVKRNGSYLCEKGLRTSPPCAQRRPWPVAVEVATSVSAERWTAELRIPLAAFERPAEKVTWGTNVVRFDEAHQEFSTWSGAYLNAYDPLSLGNLYLP